MAPLSRFAGDAPRRKLHLLWQGILLQFSVLRRHGLLHYSLVAVLLGFSGARLFHSVSLYVIAGGKPMAITGARVESPKAAATHSIDPVAAMGGALFQVFESNAVTETAPEVPTKPLKLTATLEAGADFARTLIEVQGEGTREYCAVGAQCRRGDCACTTQGISILSIAKEFIYIRSASGVQKLSMGQSTTDLTRNSAPQIPGTKSSLTAKNTITKYISREEIRKLMHGGDALTGVNIQPYMKDGRISGYKVLQLAPSHILTKLGALPGDTVRKADGYPIDGLERVLELLRHVEKMPAVKVEVERGGKTVIYDLQIRN